MGSWDSIFQKPETDPEYYQVFTNTAVFGAELNCCLFGLSCLDKGIFSF